MHPVAGFLHDNDGSRFNVGDTFLENNEKSGVHESRCLIVQTENNDAGEWSMAYCEKFTEIQVKG